MRRRFAAISIIMKQHIVVPVRTGSTFFCDSYSFLNASKASGEIPEGWSAMLVALPMVANDLLEVYKKEICCFDVQFHLQKTTSSSHTKSKKARLNVEQR